MDSREHKPTYPRLERHASRRPDEEERGALGRILQDLSLEAPSSTEMHDLNNLLAAILGYAELLQQELPEQSEGAVYATRIIHASEKAQDLVGQISARVAGAGKPPS